MDQLEEKQLLVGSTTTYISVNPTYDQMYKPVKGANAPWLGASVAPGQRNIVTGFVQDHYMNDSMFDHQHNAYFTNGFAESPDGMSMVGDVNHERPKKKPRKRKRKRGEPRDLVNDPRDPKKDPSNVDGFMGTWRPYSGPVGAEKVGERSEEEVVPAIPQPVEPKESGANDEEDTEVPEAKKKKLHDFNAHSVFHGERGYDYMGRTWVDPSSHLKAGRPHENFKPKKRVHTWAGHSKGISAIRFFPDYGHLLLSSSMDKTVKIWETDGQRKCMQTYHAHKKAVKDICFSNDGRQFLSCGYDKYTRLWDTETGQCIGEYTGHKFPYCVKFNPSRQHNFLVGQRNKKIIQWDTRSGKITQTYDRHLGAVNTITFVEEDRKFVTTSDDKSIIVWDFGVPVEHKYISEPTMFSMPSVSLSPNGKWLLCQSLDNQILVYGCKDRFRLNRKKKFSGHLTAGHGCEVISSPDGRMVISGSHAGEVYFWNWKTCQIMGKIKAHSDVVIGCQFHPIESSKLATASWDGTIKYWD
eukprot:TRINITY_DN565_c0_g1_i1.p1 TRINITY_DN565_c0_g1~~TRINITY_DN565_c0_g1_i1.p1  ORF type:complete len:525 (-),score=133.04 TRINITY_DN565_c0_g1_i1:33-1607(-)